MLWLHHGPVMNALAAFVNGGAETVLATAVSQQLHWDHSLTVSTRHWRCPSSPQGLQHPWT
jgi:hypothetical protein